MNIPKSLPSLLLPWYEKAKRDLPWRTDRNPYHIWVSEIMLQQTRVEAVKGYYLRFLSAFPTVEALAAADDELLQKCWEGLGYYNRVRNMKKAALQIVNNYCGKFPDTHSELIKLSGVGPYTAGAIGSIAFDLPTPAVDGNVLRVIARICNDDRAVDTDAFKRETEESLCRIYPKQAGAFTQALMELGATVCGPNQKPDCNACPCKEICRAHSAGTAEALPVRLPKRPRREEKRTVFILSCNGEYAICKRPDKGLLAGLWQFPNVEGFLTEQQAVDRVQSEGIRVSNLLYTVHRTHIFTHITWEMAGVYMEVENKAAVYTWMTPEQMEKQAALPTAFRQFGKEITNV